MPDTPADTIRRAVATLRPSSPAVAAHTVAVRLSPSVASALADWLEAVADEAERHAAAHPSHLQEEVTDGHPMAVARAVLGEEPQR